MPAIWMNIQELATLSQYQLPVKVRGIINNGWQGDGGRQCRKASTGERLIPLLKWWAGMPDFPPLSAQPFGVRGVLNHRALQA